MTNEEKVEKAIEIIQQGGTILYPTDTVWGLGCDGTNENACDKIINIKNKTQHNSFILLMDSWRMIERYVPEFHEVCYDLVDLSTQPITVIYPNSRTLAPQVISEDGSVGIRLIQHSICRQLIRGSKKPLVSTSANISGDKAPNSFKEINDKIKNSVDFILDLETDKISLNPSQIIKIDADGTVKIIRI